MDELDEPFDTLFEYKDPPTEEEALNREPQNVLQTIDPGIKELTNRQLVVSFLINDRWISELKRSYENSEAWWAVNVELLLEVYWKQYQILDTLSSRLKHPEDYELDG